MTLVSDGSYPTKTSYGTAQNAIELPIVVDNYWIHCLIVDATLILPLIDLINKSYPDGDKSIQSDIDYN